MDYLASFKFESKKHVKLTFDKQTNELSLSISGIWHQVILYEVPLLSLVTECFFQSVDTNWTMIQQEEKAEMKCQKLIDAGVDFSDFGTRRRRDFSTHDLVVSAFKKVEIANKLKSNPSSGSFMVHFV